MVEYILYKIVRHLPDQEKSSAFIDIKASSYRTQGNSPVNIILSQMDPKS
jgi:hypothetical protein